MKKVFSLRALSDPRIDEVEAAWEAQIGADELTVVLGSQLDWARAHTEEKGGDSCAYELHEESDDETHAILEVIDGKRGALTKMLTLWPAPKYWPDVGNVPIEQRTKMIADLYSHTAVEFVGRGMVLNAGGIEIKIYGRNDPLLETLRAVEQAFNLLAPPGWVASMQGRWLTLTHTNKIEG